MKSVSFGKIIIVIGIGLIIIVTGLAISPSKTGQLSPEEEIGALQRNIEEEVVLSIDDGEGDPKTFQGKLRAGMTVLDLLKEKTDEAGLTLKTKSYDIGVLIEAIGAKENGQDGKYWLYYINGEMPMVAADKNEIKPGDKVEFKFEKSLF